MTDGLYRAGPWPGLTPRGATVLLGCAVLLAAGQTALADPRQAWPDLPLLGAMAILPCALATRIVTTPGAASAVCGAYLLPRTLVSLFEPTIGPPPLLLVAALAFDLVAWLSAGDLRSLKNVWPGRARAWRKRDRRPRHVSLGRAVLAGASFGLALSIVEPPFAILLGVDPSAWSGSAGWLAAGTCVVVCAVIGSIARGTEA